MRINRLIATAVLLLACAPSLAGQPKDLQDRMSPQQFHSFGLDKLSPAEMASVAGGWSVVCERHRDFQ